MPDVQKSAQVRAGGWRTLHGGWNISFQCRFLAPAGARVRAKYGGGWFSWTRQNQTLDGVAYKTVSIGSGSLAYARVQIRVQQDTIVDYTYVATGP